MHLCKASGYEIDIGNSLLRTQQYFTKMNVRSLNSIWCPFWIQLVCDHNYHLLINIKLNDSNNKFSDNMHWIFPKSINSVNVKCNLKSTDCWTGQWTNRPPQIVCYATWQVSLTWNEVYMRYTEYDHWK